MSSSEFSDQDEPMSDMSSGDKGDDVDKDIDMLAEGGSRISRFKKPKISERKYHSYKKQKPDKGKSTAGKGTRNFGKLAVLKDMTLDIFFEITSHLQPLDILNLSRVSKQFRTIFSSKNSRHIWVAAKRNIAPTMPECPADLSEPQYASLLFEHQCQACDKNRAQKTDFALRLRFCGHCFDENVVKGVQTLKDYPKNIDQVVFNLVPRSFLKSPQVFKGGRKIDNGRPFDSVDNTRWNAYYIPEITSVIERYIKLKSDPTALESFVTAQKALTSQLMKDATTLSNWVAASRQSKSQVNTDIKGIRRASIEEKLEDLGWDRKFFPSGYHREWYSLLNQPRELTPRTWTVMQPKLEAILRQEIENLAQRELQMRKDERMQEFSLIWAEYTKNNLEADQSPIIPKPQEICEFTPVNEMLFSGEGRMPVTKERWNTIVDCIPEQVDLFRKQVRYTLVHRLKCIPAAVELGYGLDGPNIEGACDSSELEQASAIFRCKSRQFWGCKEILVGIPGILAHQHLGGLCWTDICSNIRGDSEVKPVVAMILEAAGLPKDTSLETLQDLGDKFLCRCGHPDHRDPMSFPSLIKHIIAENDDYQECKCRKRSHGAIDFDTLGIEIYNDHNPTDPEPWVALLSDTGESLPLRVQPEGGGVPVNDVPVPGMHFDHQKLCKYCFIMWKPVSFETKEQRNYHMRAKHHREKIEDEDVKQSGVLQSWKSSLFRSLRLR